MTAHALFEPAVAPHRFVHTIDGQPVDAERRLSVVNPATGAVFCSVPEAGADHLEQAVAAASRAQPGWARLDHGARRDALRAIPGLLTQHRAELASLLVLEQGESMAAALGEIDRAASQLGLLLAIELRDEEITDSSGRRVRLHYCPLGVVGAITPWNMPVVLMVPKVAHALYTGNTVVVKPSSYTPLTTLRLGELAASLMPPGVLNVIAGGNEIGRLMAEHPGIRKIAFTGSVATGKRVMASAAATLKRVTLKLGGNDAAVVFDDVDPSRVAPKLFAGAFANAGQVCMAIKRLYAHECIYEPMCEALAALARASKVSDGSTDGIQMGPLQNRAQYDIVRELIDDTRRNGGRILSGGVIETGSGYFIQPVVVADLAEGTRLVDEEQFGPVLPVLRFADTEDVIARASATDFGLGASVWSADLERAEAVAQRLEAGSVRINHHVGTDVLVPFRGAKQSGIGRQYSLEGLRGFMEVQALYAPVALD